METREQERQDSPNNEHENPFVQIARMAPAPGSNDSFSRPVIEHFKSVLENTQRSAMMISVIYLLADALGGRFAVSRAMFLVAGFLVSWALKVFISYQSGNDFFNMYSKVLLSVGAVFYAGAISVLLHRFDRFFFTVIFTLWPCYYLPQFSAASEVMIYMMYHVFSLYLFYTEDTRDIIYANLGVCVFQCCGVVNMTKILQAAIHRENENQASLAASAGQASRVKLMQFQIRDLLERGFDGIVQLQDGRVTWFSEKFAKLFPKVINGEMLESAFAPEDGPRLQDICAGKQSGILHTASGTFKCQIFAGPAPPGEDSDAGAKLLALRVGGRKESDDFSSGASGPKSVEKRSERLTAQPKQKLKTSFAMWVVAAANGMIVRESETLNVFFDAKLEGLHLNLYVDDPTRLVDQVVTTLAKLNASTSRLLKLGTFIFHPAMQTGLSLHLQANWYIAREDTLHCKSDLIGLVLTDCVVW